MGYKAGRTMGVLTYTKADRLLIGRDELTIGNNTKLVRRDNGIAVRHWSTDIITYHPNGSISLQAHNSATTRARYNSYLNQRVWTEDGWMFINDSNGNEYRFEDDLMIESDGTINRTPLFCEKVGDYLGKEIPTTDVLAQTVAAFNLDEMSKVWNKFKKYRYFLARFCTESFLPLVIVKDGDYDAPWRGVAAERLRAA